MRILAISDWRVQRPELLEKLLAEQKPDCVLYTGDDVHRFMGPPDELLIDGHGDDVLVLTYPELRPQNKVKKASEEHINVRNLLRKVDFPVGDLHGIIDQPLFMVNGNDDKIICTKQKVYFRARYPFYYSVKEDGSEQDGKTGDDDDDNYFWLHGFVYAPLSALRQRTYIEGSRVSVFGALCTYGLGSDVIETSWKKADIYLTHIPPIGCLDLSRRHGISHIGSSNVREAVEKFKPKFLVCGHSHFWGGCSTRIGRTTVINVSASDRERDTTWAPFAVIDTDDWSYRIEHVYLEKHVSIRGLRTLKGRLEESSNKASRKKQKGKLNRLSGCSDDLEGLISNGVDVEILASLLDELKKDNIDTSDVEIRLEAIKEGHPIIHKPLSFHPDEVTFVDVETGLARGLHFPGKLWLVGFLHKGEVTQFEWPRQNRTIVSFLRKNAITVLASWTMYDHYALRPIKEKYTLTMIDACKRVANCLAWSSYALDKLYYALYKDAPNEDLISGRAAGIYADHLFGKNLFCDFCPAEGDLRAQIRLKNKHDLIKTYQVCRKVIEEKGIRRRVPANGKKPSEKTELQVLQQEFTSSCSVASKHIRRGTLVHDLFVDLKKLARLYWKWLSELGDPSFGKLWKWNAHGDISSVHISGTQIPKDGINSGYHWLSTKEYVKIALSWELWDGVDEEPVIELALAIPYGKRWDKTRKSSYEKLLKKLHLNVQQEVEDCSLDLKSRCVSLAFCVHDNSEDDVFIESCDADCCDSGLSAFETIERGLKVYLVTFSKELGIKKEIDFASLLHDRHKHF